MARVRLRLASTSAGGRARNCRKIEVNRVYKISRQEQEEPKVRNETIVEEGRSGIDATACWQLIFPIVPSTICIGRELCSPHLWDSHGGNSSESNCESNGETKHIEVDDL